MSQEAPSTVFSPPDEPLVEGLDETQSEHLGNDPSMHDDLVEDDLEDDRFEDSDFQDEGEVDGAQSEPSAVEDVSPTEVEILVDQVEAPLAFEVGESRLSLGQLRSLAAGYTFELLTPVENPVVIKAFGQVIGRGQLVQIGDRIGVRVVEVSINGTR